MCFSVGVGRNALPWFQPSASGKEIVASGGARCLRCARMVRIASGSVTSAITRSVPPHSGQTEISISNTRLSRSAQLNGEQCGA